MQEYVVYKITNNVNNKIQSGEIVPLKGGSGKASTEEDEILRKQKISKCMKDKPKSEAHKRKISEKIKELHNLGLSKLGDPKKGSKKPCAQCPHCGKIGSVSNMPRWHFDNCKNR